MVIGIGSLLIYTYTFLFILFVFVSNWVMARLLGHEKEMEQEYSQLQETLYLS